MESMLKLEHDIDALEQHNAELEEQVATYKAKVAEYAGVVKEMRRDMEGMERMQKDQEEIIGNIIDVFDDYLDEENAVIVGDDYDMLAGKIEKILKGAE
jgi:predicted RNase H-like nuclease (RuvC/YqgF family)